VFFDFHIIVVAEPSFGEVRELAIGIIDGREVTIVYTWRGDDIRIISVRGHELMSENYSMSTERNVDKCLKENNEQLVQVSGRKPKGIKTRTDWDRVDNMTEEELEKAIKNDPDTLTLDNVDLSTLRLVKP